MVHITLKMAQIALLLSSKTHDKLDAIVMMLEDLQDIKQQREGELHKSQ